MNFNDVLHLHYGLFALYRKESWYNLTKQSEEGREFLKTLWRLNQTEADINAIRNFQNKEVRK